MVEERFPDVCLICSPTNEGFAKAVNRGAAVAHGQHLLCLNSDARLFPGALAALLAIVEVRPRAGAVGARVLNPDGTLQASHAAFPTLGRELLILSGLGRLLHGPAYPSHRAEEVAPRPADYVSGACMLVRRAAFDEVGGFDERYFLYAEEVDLCYGLRAHRWEVWYQPAAQVVHRGGASSAERGREREAALYRSRIRFFRKHYGDRAAARLTACIYAITAAKIVFHRTLRLASHGRWGRDIVAWRDLTSALRDA